MMSPTWSELDSTGNVFHDVPPDLVVSTQKNSWLPSDRAGRRIRRVSERSKPARRTGDLGGHQGPEIHDKISLTENEKVQRRVAAVDRSYPKYDKTLGASKHRSHQRSPAKVEITREKLDDMRYGLIANPHALLAESSREGWNLSHVEKWVREQEFLLYRPKDIEPFTPEPACDSSSSQRKSSVHSSSLDGSGNFPLRGTRQQQGQSGYENRYFFRDMRPPVISPRSGKGEMEFSNRKPERDRLSKSLYHRNSPRGRIPPTYEDSIRALKGSPVVDSPSQFQQSEQSYVPPSTETQNGYRKVDREVLPSYPRFSYLRSNRNESDSHSWDRKYASQRFLNKDEGLRGIDEYLSTSNLPDVAKEASRSTTVLAKPLQDGFENRTNSALNENIVLRRNMNGSSDCNLENRKFKAQSWPKFTVTSTVMPTAKKVMVTPVGSLNSVALVDDIGANGAKVSSKGLSKQNDTFTPEEEAFLKKYILTDEGDSWTNEDSLKTGSKLNTPIETANASLNQASDDAKDKVMAEDVSDIAFQSSLDFPVDSHRNVSNYSTPAPEIDSARDYQNTLSGISTQKTQPSYPSPISTSDSTYKATNASEPQQSIFRQSAGYKRASGGLKDLIRLHEQEIARVANTNSNRKPPLPPSTRKESFTHRHTSIGIGVREKSEPELNNLDTRWKRHTTIGLVNVPDISPGSKIVKESVITPIDRPTSSNACPSTETGFDSMPERKNMNPDLLIQDDRQPPPLPPKPKYFAEQVRAIRQKSLDEAPDITPRQRTRSRRSEEEARSELEKVTRTLESFKSLSIERVETSCQTDGRVYYEEEVNALTSGLTASITEQQDQLKHEVSERIELERKLNEQKKVANAYQKLEDRYRRRVHDLQKVLMTCTCEAGFVMSKNKHNHNINNTFPRHGKNVIRPQSDNEEKTAAKVDGILQELESWLSAQQGSKTNSSSEELSAIHLQAKSLENLRGNFSDGRRVRENPPFEILDDIDATCV